MLGLQFEMPVSLILLSYKILELNKERADWKNVIFQFMLWFLCHTVDPVCGFVCFFLYENMEVTLMEVLLTRLTLAHSTQMLVFSVKTVVGNERKGGSWRNQNTPVAALGGCGHTVYEGVRERNESLLFLYLLADPSGHHTAGHLIGSSCGDGFLSRTSGCLPACSA